MSSLVRHPIHPPARRWLVRTISWLIVAGVIWSRGALANMADVRTIKLPLRRKNNVTCQPAPDGVAGLLLARGRGAAKLLSLGEALRLGPYEMRLRRKYDNSVEGLIHLDSGVVRCVLRRTARSIHLLVGRPTVDQQLAELQRSVLQAVPIETDAATMEIVSRANKLLADRRHEQALSLLGPLEKKRHLDDYIRLRRADIHLAAGQVPTAHLHYKNLAALRPTESMGLLSAVRAAQLDYLLERRAPRENLSSYALAARGAPGAFAARHLARLLLRSGRNKDVLLLARRSELPELRPAAHAAIEIEVRLALWRGDPFAAVLAFELGRPFLDDHPREVSVSLQGARAYLELGLATDAAPLLQRALQKAENADQREQSIAALVDAFSEQGDRFRARQAADYYLSRFSSSFRAPRIRYQRAWLRLLEGDQAGARADMRRLPAPMRDKLLQLLESQPKVSSAAGPIARLAQRPNTRKGPR
jgi:hypothetical protein